MAYYFKITGRDELSTIVTIDKPIICAACIQNVDGTFWHINVSDSNAISICYFSRKCNNINIVNGAIEDIFKDMKDGASFIDVDLLIDMNKSKFDVIDQRLDELENTIKTVINEREDKKE